MQLFPDQGVRTPTSRSLRIRGVIAAVALAVTAIGLYQLGTGGYTDTFKLTVLTDSIGEGLTPGAEVKFRGLTIGSVKELQAIGYNKQKMTVELEPEQARALAIDTTAKFTTSNAFGLAAVELDSTGAGPRLKPNQTLMISASEGTITSITGLLRQGQKIGQLIDSPDVNHIIAVVRRHLDLTEPVTRAYFDLIKMLTDSQRVPFSQSLSVFASVANGLNDSIPLIGLAYDLLNGMDFLAHPDGVARMNAILDQTSKFLFNMDAIFAKNIAWLAPFINSMMNVLLPTSYAYGSLAPVYDRISGLLDRTSAAFPIVNGKPRLQVDVTLDAMPGLAAALPGAPAATAGTTAPPGAPPALLPGPPRGGQ